MNDLPSLRDRHRALTDAFAGAGVAPLDPGFKDQLNGLLQDMHGAARKVRQAEEFLWLRDAVEQWRKVGAALGVPAAPVLEAPPDLKSEPAGLSGERRLQARVTRKAHELGRDRIVAWYISRSIDEIMSVYRDMAGDADRRRYQDDDWSRAETHLAAEVFERSLDLVHDFGPDSYWRLEGRNGGMWFSRVVALKAYFHWKEKGGGWGLDQTITDYQWAEDVLLGYLRDSGRKATWVSFEPCKAYIDRRYLDASGKLRADGPAAEWTRVKVQRLAEVGGISGTTETLPRARDFMRLFYENLAPAVLDRNQQSVQRVAEALGLLPGAEANRPMVNCFEMAVAVYFLDVAQLFRADQPSRPAEMPPGDAAAVPARV